MNTTLTLHNKSYIDRRNWADQYTNDLNQIAARILFADARLLSVYFKSPSISDDRRKGMDMYIEMERAKFSYRIRKAEHKPYFLEGFTIRNLSRFGPTELEKIQQDDYADFLLYAVAHPENFGEVDCAVLIDLKLLGAQLKAYPHLIKQAVQKNGFISFDYDAFPEPVVVGMYGVQRKGEH